MNRIIFCLALIFACFFTVQSQNNPDPYNIGDIGPGGGVIFYKKVDWTDGWKYLEAAKLDWLGGLPGYSGNLTDPVKAFGKSSDPDYNDTSILVGSGDQNTFEISSFENDFNHDFYMNVYGDIRGWYLPSKDEAVLLYEYIRDYGNNYLNLAENVYYTSSSDPGNTIIGWTVDMRDGYWGYSGKLGGLRKRAIRKVTFTDFSPNTNYSAYFSTNSSSINFGPSSNFSLNTDTTRSILFWLKPEGSGHVISKYRNFDSQNSDFLVTYRADTEDILFSGNGTTSHVFGSIPLNQWTHIAITIRSTESGNVIKGFVNGELKIEENINLSNNTVQEDFFVGSNPNLSGGDNGFIGFIDDLSFWDSVDGYYQTDKLRPFNSQEINSIATIPATGKESRLISLWNFDQENIQNNSINGQNVESGNETSYLVEYNNDSPYEYNLAPSDVGFLEGDQLVDEIDINDDTSANSVIGSLSATDIDNSLESLTISLDDNSGTQNHNEYFAIENNQLKILIQPNLGATDDSDVDTYLTATGLNEITYTQALNTFVSRLKSNGIWNKLIAIYPILGGGSESSSYNLKDPSAFQIQWPSDFTFNSGGVLTSGISSANTGIGIYNTDLSIDNASVSIM